MCQLTKESAFAGPALRKLPTHVLIPGVEGTLLRQLVLQLALDHRNRVKLGLKPMLCS